MAVLIPESCPPSANQGAKNIYRLLQDVLPDDFTVWYEPGCGREGGRDFTVLSANFGMLLLAVRAWYPKDLRESPEILTPDPLTQLGDELATIRQGLLKEPLLCEGDNLRIPTGVGVVLSNITRAQLKETDHEATFAAPRTLCRDELAALVAGRSDRETLRAFGAMLADAIPFAPLTSEEASTLRAMLHPETTVRSRPAPDSAVGGATGQPGGTILDAMDRQQEQIARSMGDGHRILFGAAGSGKTLLLLFRARHLASAERRILVLCYNRVLGNYLRDQLSEASGVSVFNFHAWAGQLTGVRKEGNAETWDAYNRRLLAALKTALERLPMSSRYDAILVDEAHDFELDWFPLLPAALKDPEKGDLVLAIDGAQSLYGRPRRFTWASVGIRAVGRSRRLVQNYRNPQPILDFAWELAQADRPTEDESETQPRMKPEQSLRPGAKPECHPCKNFRDEQETLARLVSTLCQEGVAPREIAILYARADGGRIADLKAALERAGVEVCWASDPRDRSQRDHMDRLPGVRLLTIHSAKGLEFRVVILCGLDQFPDRNHVDPDRDANLLYVGLTRATERLFVTWVGQSPFTKRALELVG